MFTVANMNIAMGGFSWDNVRLFWSEFSTAKISLKRHFSIHNMAGCRMNDENQ